MAAPSDPPRNDYVENGMRLLDTVSTWLAVAHLGGLAFVYNATLAQQLAFRDPIPLLCCILIAGAATAFMFKVLVAIEFVRGHWPYRLNLPWLMLICSGLGLFAALSAPLFYPLIAER